VWERTNVALSVVLQEPLNPSPSASPVSSSSSLIRDKNMLISIKGKWKF
ncbi:hypothetical protein V6N12_063801, partial [Hibiscus sabdariffa]